MNKDKIEVGEYVRTDYEIYKIVKFMKNENGKIVGAYDEKGFYRNFNLFHIVKHSKNIIELIEEGDYVNGEKVLRISDIEKDKKAFVIFKFGETEHCKIWNNEDIKSIITKEQFKSIEYKV